MKQKSNRALLKKIKVTGSGKIKRKKAYMNHILTKKETKQKRNLAQKTTVKKVDEGNIKPMLPYAF